MNRVRKASVTQVASSPLVITAIGVILVTSSLTLYQLSANSLRVVATADIGFFEEIAYATLGLTVVGIALALLGATSLFRRVPDEGSPLGRHSSLSRISVVLSDRRCARVFIAAAMSYGILFAFISSELVFQPGSDFSHLSGVQIPSIVPVICCGTIGQMPQFVVYVTQQFALLVIPLNLILLSVASWLVGINAASVRYLYTYRLRPLGLRWFGGLGAIVALFTACPTCAGFFFLSVLGFSSAVTAALTLASLQGIFVLVGFPILVIATALNVRQIDLSCNLDRPNVGEKGIRLNRARKKTGSLVR